MCDFNAKGVSGAEICNSQNSVDRSVAVCQSRACAKSVGRPPRAPDRLFARLTVNEGLVHTKNHKYIKTIMNITYPAFALFAFACFALSPPAQAVSPAPDGCYPSLTTAEGCNALAGLGTGTGNTGVGWNALFSAGDSSFSTGVGAGALALNTADSNTAVGAAALLLNATGILNVAVGTGAMVNNSGSNNTAVGAFAGSNISGGSSANVTVGTGSTTSGTGITTGGNNTVVGDQAGLGITSANNETIIGNNAGGNPLVLNDCIYIGHNVGSGFSALEANTIRIGDNLPTSAGASQCFIGGILSNMTPVTMGTPVVTINTTTGQLGWGPDFSSKIAEQQKKIEEQQASISQLKSEMQTMVAQLKEQAAQIQKVSAQLEMSTPATKMVVNKP